MVGEIEFGILNIDKPSGPTSFDVSDFVRKKLGLRKTSHFGTLDPKVTGVLPIALNRGCKLTGFFIGHDKEYVGVMRIHEDMDMKEIQKVIDKKFVGKIKQTPPVKSRVKRQEREREVKKFKLLEQDGKDILFECEVEGGTYIRKLIDDLGSELGIGAHMLELRRIRAGIFEEKNSITLYELEKTVEDGKLEEFIIPGEEALREIFPVVEVKKELIEKLLTGKPIHEGEVVKGKVEDKFIVFDGKRFIGVYKKVDEGRVIAKPQFVLQDVR